ncbi:MAG: hypothetical protein ISP46_03830 [Alphaproteobacteria bacterium]|nr:hypothetical protein [Alphaproteobacteria bacterium]
MMDTIRSALIQFFEYPDVAWLLAKMPFIQDLALNQPLTLTVFVSLIFVLLIMLIFSSSGKPQPKSDHNQDSQRVLNKTLRRKLARLRHTKMPLYSIEVTEDHMIRMPEPEAEKPMDTPSLDRQSQPIEGNSLDITKNRLSPEARAMLEKLHQDGKAN